MPRKRKPPRRTQPLKREVKALEELPAREVKALELPMRYRSAALQTVADRNERLRALKAAALRSDLQRVEAMLEANPHVAVTAAANRIRDDLKALASKSLP